LLSETDEIFGGLDFELSNEAMFLVGSGDMLFLAEVTMGDLVCCETGV
jgi:hypothetical protein